MGCFFSKEAGTTDDGPALARAKRHVSIKVNDPDSSESLARVTNFSFDEVESLKELYIKLSNELHHDGLIHKDELAWALFKSHRDNLFVDRVFELFDMKQNNVIEFGEFVLSLSVFHPNAPLEEKAKCTYFEALV